jgi:hypothetical protein
VVTYETPPAGAVELPEVNGDGGLYEACKLFWLLDTLTLSLSASGELRPNDPYGASIPYSISTAAVRPSRAAPHERAALTNRYIGPILLEQGPNGYGTDGYFESYPEGGASAFSGGAWIGYSAGKWYLLASLVASCIADAEYGASSSTRVWSLGSPPSNYSTTGEIYEGTEERTDTSGTYTTAGTLSIAGHDYPVYTGLLTKTLFISGTSYAASAPTLSVTPASTHSFYTLV